MKTQIIIPIIISLLSFCSLTTSREFLNRGSSFSVEDTSSFSLLTSPDKTFTCGFYNLRDLNANAYWFSIWFTNSKERTVVWMANRDNPVNGRGSKLTLRKDGAFILTDLDGSIAWQTNTSMTDVDKVELLNSGNLVLKDPLGKILWQSFEFPTDTLLPNQSFTKTKRLVSRISPHMFGSGYFSFFFDSDNSLKMIYDGPEISSIYWPNVDSTVFQNGRTDYNSSRIAVLDDMGRFVSSDQLQFNASDMGVGIKRRLTIDYDGNLRLYSLNESSGLWVITWQAVSNPCDVHGLCGRNGVCVFTPEPKCSCPPNYEPNDQTDWGKGCKPKFNRSCNDSHFIELPYVDFWGYDHNVTQSSSSFEDCRQRCLGDCRCEAFSYRPLTGAGMCFPKNSLFNGYRSNAFPGSIYLRVPLGMQTPATTSLNVARLNCTNRKDRIVLLRGTSDNTNQRFNWVYMYAFALAIGAVEIVMLFVSWFLLFKKHGISTSMEDGYRVISSHFRSFSYSELKTATNKFKNVLGRGGFGVVYKGVLEDERIVAVKKLGDLVHGEEEFWAEVRTIGRINHMNLARMWGFCSEKKYRLLVYEYVENGSLDKHLFSNKTLLAWNDRFKIAIGTAKGLAYLHHECLEWVIHCDVKPENILLDRDFEPKISDFGLAKLCQRGGHGSSELTKIRGTKGYMAPEWAMNLPITAKVDVYGYGVVILELVTGIRLSNRVVDDQINEGESELVRFVRLAKGKSHKEGKAWVKDLVDQRLEGKFNKKDAVIMIEVGLACVEEDRNKRPTMETVAQMLMECVENAL